MALLGPDDPESVRVAAFEEAEKPVGAAIMPWLYLLALSILILIVWWALSRTAETTIAPGDQLPKAESKEEPVQQSSKDGPEGPVQ